MTTKVQCEEDKNQSIGDDEWLIRKCSSYHDEYKDCTSVRGRLHQLFVYGKTIDCGQWKRDSINCSKWIDQNDITAAKELIDSEKERRKQRLLAHYKNDVWTKRKAPPKDWNNPLPEDMQKEYENTYLNIKSKEMRGEIPPTFDFNMSGTCTIL